MGTARDRTVRLATVGMAVALGLGAIGLSVQAGGRAKAAVVGGNLPVNAGATNAADINAHNSPTIARNPVDPVNVAVVNRIDAPLFSCALHVSFDAGASFAQRSIPVPPGEEPKCYAPDLAYGPDGTLYVLYVTLRGVQNVPNAVWTVSSPDGGRNLSAPRKAIGPLAFQVRLVADPVVNDSLFVTWLQAGDTATLAFPEPGYPIMSARSLDGGESWSDPARVSPPARARVVAPTLTTGQTGQLFVAYLDLGADRLDYEGAHGGRGGEPYDGTWALVVARSDDGGRTWNESSVDDSLVPTGRFIVFIPPHPSIVADSRGRSVYVAFHEGREGDADVRVWVSDDGGATFGRSRRVNDTPIGDGTSQYQPRLALAPNGRLDVVYYDRRNDRDDVMNEVSFQSSFDGGRSFEPRLVASDRPFDSRIGPGSNVGLTDLGSRLGLVSTDRRTLAVWSDTRAGTDASGKQDLVRAVVSVKRGSTLPESIRWVLRAAGLALLAIAVALIVQGRHPPVDSPPPGPNSAENVR